MGKIKKKFRIWVETPDKTCSYCYYAKNRNDALNKLIKEMYSCKTTYEIISKANVMHVLELPIC